MTISTFVPSLSRPKIAYVGSISQDVTEELELQGFTVVELDEAQLAMPGVLQQIDSVLLFQTEDKPSRIYRDLEIFASTLLTHDCRIYVQHQPHLKAHEDGGYRRRQVINAIKTLLLPAHAYSLNEAERQLFAGTNTVIDRVTYAPYVYVVPSPCNWRDMAKTIRNNPAGVAPNIATKVELVSGGLDDIAICSEAELLIQRAFHDCKTVDLVPISNGMSGVATYRVYAELRDNIPPTQWPYVYFVKLGGRQMIEKEHYNYRESAMGHIPYHLGPRLKLDRCALGHEMGILVSDYVAGAETLKDCARDGRAAMAVGNLFSTTIASWRSGAKSEQRNLPETLSKSFPENIPDHRKQLMQDFGSSLDLAAFKLRFDALDSTPVLMGVIHGDLHATNVLVRGSDAIIIDFEKIAMDMPVLFDAASLEAGLFINGFIGDRRSWSEVLDSVEQLYSLDAFNGEVQPCHPRDGSCWYFDCVRQIRLHTKSMELQPHQYAWTLACLLAKKSCNRRDFSNDVGIPGMLFREEVRAMAMVLAERIIKALP